MIFFLFSICIEDNVYGVIAIPVDEYTLDSFEYSIFAFPFSFMAQIRIVDPFGVYLIALSITRLNDGRLKLKFTDQLLDEVIAESLRHISRKHEEYQIVTECDDCLRSYFSLYKTFQIYVASFHHMI